MFYCIAMQAGASLSWQWKSTPLSSLDAMLGFLRLHRALPQDRAWTEILVQIQRGELQP